MPARNKSKRTYRRKNIVGNFRGSEDIFMTKVRDGFIKFLESPFKKYGPGWSRNWRQIVYQQE